MEIIKKLNLPLVILPFFIFSLGYMTLLSSSPDKARSHLLFFVLGIVAYVGMCFINPSIFSYLWKHIYVVSLFLLLFTYLLGEVRLGASRWLNIGIFSFQPSELAKFSLIIFVSAFLTTYVDTVKKLGRMSILLLFVAPLVLLVYFQPDLGTSLVLAIVFGGMLFFSGVSKMYFVILFFIFGIFSAPIWSLLKDYQKQRILVFLNPTLDVRGSGYNVIQAMIAIGSGGFGGKGFLRGTQAIMEFLPSHYTDFAFASFCEEWGFLGAILMIFLYVSLLLNILAISRTVSSHFQKIISIGVFFVFFSQFFINIGMNIGLLPVTGIPLPFVSYGGSSLVLSMILLGMIQGIWLRREF